MCDSYCQDCYVCGKAAYVADSKTDPMGCVYHEECYPTLLSSVACPPRKELDDIKRDPMKWFEEAKKRKLPQSLKYLITFTWNNSVCKDKWKKKVSQQLKRKNVKQIYGIGLEHPDSNIHVHAYIEATGNLRKRDYQPFEKSYGYVDVKHIKIDNGVEEYISKENLIELEALQL